MGSEASPEKKGLRSLVPLISLNSLTSAACHRVDSMTSFLLVLCYQCHQLFICLHKA